jgi:hypothetical protein
MERSEHAADIRVGIASEQMVDRVGIQQHISVGEDHNIAGRARGELFHAVRLTAATRPPDQSDEIALPGDQGGGIVTRSIVEGEDFKGGVVALEHGKVRQLFRHRRRFIISAEEQRGGWNGSRSGLFRHSRQAPQDQRVAKEGPGDRDQTEQQDQRQDDIGRVHQ